uniref:Uncharacterized protein n=1 Tax=Timema poppense TaxID=170557 RepID=A0A7R9H4N8_TIMPO|nr:unnamed protein product [Timema poppensis]
MFQLAKRQMPDMDMMKNIAPALMDQMIKETSNAMAEKVAEGGTKEEAMEEGTKKMIEMGASAMQMELNLGINILAGSWKMANGYTGVGLATPGM